MADRYTVEAWVPPGVLVAESEWPTFDAMLAEAARLRAKYPDAVQSYGNIERADIGDDGLTDHERERAEYAGTTGYCACGRPLVPVAAATRSSPEEWGCPVCDGGLTAQEYARIWREPDPDEPYDNVENEHDGP